jgi:hypothetical protein
MYYEGAVLLACNESTSSLVTWSGIPILTQMGDIARPPDAGVLRKLEAMVTFQIFLSRCEAASEPNDRIRHSFNTVRVSTLRCLCQHRSPKEEKNS